MAEARVVLVAGASGAAANRILERAAAAHGFEAAVGLSRRAPPGAGPWIEADLADAGSLARALSARPDVTHLVYASRAPHAESGVEDVAAHLAMLRNLLDAAEAALPRFARIHLVEGGKWYGMHIGPYRTPAREDDPRHMPPNFYYDQQDLLAERRRGRVRRAAGRARLATCRRPGPGSPRSPARRRPPPARRRPSASW